MHELQSPSGCQSWPREPNLALQLAAVGASSVAVISGVNTQIRIGGDFLNFAL